ncbi:MAG: HAD hydrolase-like protein [Acidimicrobiia bacterium]|nr:HAD hydrolase-like protein [Acidimicrobiia bacterium]
MTDLADVVDLIVFDFDGTICESADVKTEAFYELYLDEHGEEFATQVRDYHLVHAGVSRYDKIRYYEEELLGRECTEERMSEVADRFGGIVRDRVIASPLVPGVAAFFSRYRNAVPMLVASATPTAELRQIIAARDMTSWFDAVEGSPALKGDIIKQFLAERGALPQRAVMVGDQFSDLDAAVAAGVHFVAYRPPHEERLFDGEVLVVGHFDELADAIATLAGGGLS